MPSGPIMVFGESCAGQQALHHLEGQLRLLPGLAAAPRRTRRPGRSSWRSCGCRRPMRKPAGVCAGSPAPRASPPSRRYSSKRSVALPTRRPPSAGRRTCASARPSMRSSAVVRPHARRPAGESGRHRPDPHQRATRRCGRPSPCRRRRGRATPSARVTAGRRRRAARRARSRRRAGSGSRCSASSQAAIGPAVDGDDLVAGQRGPPASAGEPGLDRADHRPVESRSRRPRPSPIMKSAGEHADGQHRVHEGPGQVDEEALPARAGA